MRRVHTRGLLVGIVVVASLTLGGVSQVSASSGASRATRHGVVEAECVIAGYLNFAPGLTTTPQPIAISLSDARIEDSEGCPLVPKATPTAPVSGTLYTTSMHCQDRQSDVLVTDAPATGILTIKWPGQPSSRWRATFAVKNKIGRHGHHDETFVFAGKVRKGTYAGDRTLAHTGHILTRGGCLPSDDPLTQTSFFAYSNYQQERLLTFTTP
jgi:hypothetical protein